MPVKPLKFGNPTSDVAIKPDPIRRYAKAFKPLPGAPEPVALEHNKGCRWPIGDDPILFCGCETETGRYCPTHERMSGVRLPAVKV